MISFRNADVDLPFLWESEAQPAQRWHATGDGPAHYLASTPDAAWGEFCRHQEIREPDDLAGIERALWAVEIDDQEPMVEPDLPTETVAGNEATYPGCQAEAGRLRGAGASGLRVPSAAIDPSTPSGWHVDDGLRPADPRPELTIVLFGLRADLTGWRACAPGRPAADLLSRVRYR